jgi:transcriptional regulator with XRE-family HTH domain
MKKYIRLGELLVDFRRFRQLSQSDLAALLNVDIRTVIRWEKDETLIKAEKEEELVEVTFIPYQVIRNLNASIAIPTYYDFRLRKYSLSERSIELPKAEWFRDQMEISTDRIRKIEHKADIDLILKYHKTQYGTSKIIHHALIHEAVRLLPGLNLVMIDKAGFYCGHVVVFPLKITAYEKLKKREIDEGQLTTKDFADPGKEHVKHYHLFDISADCNENSYYILAAMLKYFKGLIDSTYTYSVITARYDNYETSKKMGLSIVWECQSSALSTGVPFRFQEGNFSDFLAEGS